MLTYQLLLSVGGILLIIYKIHNGVTNNNPNPIALFWTTDTIKPTTLAKVVYGCIAAMLVSINAAFLWAKDIKTKVFDMI